MTTGMTAAVLNGWLNAFGNAADYTAPTAIWIKLHTGDPGSAGTANAAANTERQQASFATASGGSMATDTDLEWDDVPNTETYSHWSAWTASSGGTFLASDDLVTPIPIEAHATFKILAGGLVIQITPVAA